MKRNIIIESGGWGGEGGYLANYYYRLGCSCFFTLLIATICSLFLLPLPLVPLLLNIVCIGDLKRKGMKLHEFVRVCGRVCVLACVRACVCDM